MKRLILLMALTGCADTSLYIGAHYKIPLPGIEFKGGNPAAVFRVQKQYTDLVSCEYMHVSHWFTGFPFNHDREQSLDTIGCGYKFDMLKHK